MISKIFHRLFIIIFLVVVLFANYGCIDISGKQGDDCGQCIKVRRATINETGRFIIVGRTNSPGSGNYDGFIATYSFAPFVLPTFLQLEWARLISIQGTVGNDQANCVMVDDANHYVLCGYVNNPNPGGSKEDVLLAKFDNDGNYVFKCAYDVSDNKKNDEATKMIVDNQGNYVIVGTTFSNDAQGDILVAKFNPDGGRILSGFIGKQNVYERGWAIIQDRNDDYVVVGCTTNNPGNQDKDIVIVKLKHTNNNFSTVESVRLKRSGDDCPRAIVCSEGITTVPFYVVAGFTTSPQYKRDLLIFKINENLSIANFLGKNFREQNHDEHDEIATSLIKSADNDLVVGGYSQDYSVIPPSSDALIAKFYQNSLSLKWAKCTNITTIPVTNYQHNFIASIIELSASSVPLQVYVATGYTMPSAAGNNDILVASFANSGADDCSSTISLEANSWLPRIEPYCELQECLLTLHDIVGVRDWAPAVENICPL